MVDVTIDGDRAVFNVEGFHKLWTLRSRLEIPLAHIVDVEVNAEQVGVWWHGIRLRVRKCPAFSQAAPSTIRGSWCFST